MGLRGEQTEKAISIIKGWIKEWSETPSPIDVRLREKEGITAREEKIKKHHERALELIRKSILVNE